MYKNRRCPYSDSCFECPLSDCVIGTTYANTVNALPSDPYKRKFPISEKTQSTKQRKRAKEVAIRRGRHTANNKRTVTD